MSPEEREALARAGARLRPLDLYPRPVDLERVRIVTAPWLFRLPWFRRFGGYAVHGTILLRRPVAEVGEDLIAHELCHVWQLQHHPIRMPLSFLRTGYEHNPYEQEARRAAALTRDP